MKTLIIHIIPRLSFSGGIENYVRNLCYYANQDRFNNYIITFFINNDNEIVNELNQKGIKIFSLKPVLFEKINNRYLKFILKNFTFSYIKKYKSLNKILQTLSPDLLVFHGEDCELIGGFISSNHKKVNVIHGLSFFPLNPIYQFILNHHSRKKYNKTIFINESLKTSFGKFGQSNCFVIPSGIDIKKLNSYCDGYLMTKKLDKYNHKFILGFIGRISKEKGIYELIKGFSLIKKENLILKIAGDGNEFSQIKNLVKNLSLENKIEFLGEIKKTEEFYKQIDILIIPSRTEGLPLVMLEAMACGVLVIANNVGAISTVINNNFNGILMANNNPETIQNSIEYCLNNFHNMKSLIENAQKTVKKFSIEKSVEKFENTIMEIINNKNN